MTDESSISIFVSRGDKRDYFFTQAMEIGLITFSSLSFCSKQVVAEENSIECTDVANTIIKK
jgi:hypothetical protein